MNFQTFIRIYTKVFEYICCIDVYVTPRHCDYVTINNIVLLTQPVYF